MSFFFEPDAARARAQNREYYDLPSDDEVAQKEAPKADAAPEPAAATAAAELAPDTQPAGARGK